MSPAESSQAPDLSGFDLRSLGPAFYEKTHSGEVMSRLTADTTQIKAAAGSTLSQALRNGMMLVGALVMMFVTSPMLSCLALAATAWEGFRGVGTEPAAWLACRRPGGRLSGRGVSRRADQHADVGPHFIHLFRLGQPDQCQQ